MRKRSWFDVDKLLEGERLLRSVPARIRTDAPPHWWEGELILTSDRLFFLPSVDVPFHEGAAFWLRDVASWGASGRNRLLVVIDGVRREFDLATPATAMLIGRSAARMARDLASARATARPRPPEGQRAAG
jgi:hypothetical protein